MLEKEKVIIDVLDIFVSAKRGLAFSDIMFQLNDIYQSRGALMEKSLLTDIMNDLTMQGHLNKFKVGTVDTWKITEEGEDYFYSM
ncbi:MAG: hypothetical protein H7645_05845 [Candidatus Heimdallarchaeota archaeon]|nr:hypothetical protein [Candidatus Heimdallarchaeota archaeon]MCG3226424.1 hypothetical protein [Candidatus Heimdallarchaeota archaeon]MCK4769846.1 hypothetical protein [Candidatus Heimdallarchaeota archaeon]MCK4878261.1 hypothetical protein [Candidatus Heimdallarchaeota archaeon]